jgi:hypothetical protein
MRNNGDAVNLRGTISMPPLLAPQVYYQSGNVASNRVVLVGSANNGPMTPALVSQFRILSVEIAA